MSFSWPWALLALLIIPLVFAIWWWTRRRRKRAAVRVTSMALVRAALPGRTRWRRRIPAGLLAGGLAALASGAARPQAPGPVPTAPPGAAPPRSAEPLPPRISTPYCCPTGVPAAAIGATQKAARIFIPPQQAAPPTALAAFAGTAGLLVPPTHDTQKLLGAL